MLGEMTEMQFQRWIAYSIIEPFGEERADLRSAIIACTMANMWRGQKQRPFKVDDFMPKLGENKRAQRNKGAKPMTSAEIKAEMDKLKL